MTIQNTIAALLTLAILSVILKDNPVFRVAEHLMVGLAAAHSMVRSIDNYLKPTVVTDIGEKGQWYLAIPLVFGALMYVRHMPKIAWIARYPMSWFVGYGVGYTLAFTPRPFLKQVTDSFIALNSVDNVIYLVITLTTVAYFFFTPKWRDNTGAGKTLDVWARRVMMIGFGATFGNVVQGRISLLLGRLQFLFGDWLGLLK